MEDNWLKITYRAEPSGDDSVLLINVMARLIEESGDKKAAVIAACKFIISRFGEDK